MAKYKLPKLQPHRSTSFYKHPVVNFIKVGRMAQIIEIALSICALRLRRTITHVKSFLKSWVLHFAPCAQLYEIDPRLFLSKYQLYDFPYQANEGN